MSDYKKPDDKDEYICPHCGEKSKHRSPYMYAPRYLQKNARIQIIDRWNIPYDTGIYILAEDDVTAEEVQEFANKHVHFPFWNVHREGVLWAKSTWDD